MRKPTWLEEKEAIEEELDLQEEQFISEKQLMKWYNQAIDKCEAHIHNLNEDWFLTDSPFILSKDVRSYDLPDNIYGVSIRSFHYISSTDEYPLNRIVNINDTLDENNIISHDQYSYMVFNSEANGPQVRFYPTPTKDYLSEITINYIRNAARLEYDIVLRNEQEIDIPEFSSFCRQYVICKCHEKEKQWQSYQVAKAELNELENLMKQTLGKKEKDGQSMLTPDMESAEEYGLF